MKADASELANPAGAGHALPWRRGLPGLHPQQWLARLGLPGVFAIGLLIAAAAFYTSVMMPLEERIDEVISGVRSLNKRIEQETGGGRRSELPVGRQLAEFYQLFGSSGQLTDTVAKVFEIAQSQGVALQQGEYRVIDEPATRLRRFQMTLPLKAEYPRIRSFVAALTAEVPTAVLEHIQFERKKIGETQVEATIKLALYVGQGS